MLAEMRAQNINIFPLQPRSKIPMQAWKQYQTENFEGVIPPENNYAVVCGKISENLAVFDFDNCSDTYIGSDIYIDNYSVAHTTFAFEQRWLPLHPASSCV